MQKARDGVAFIRAGAEFMASGLRFAAPE